MFFKYLTEIGEAVKTDGIGDLHNISTVVFQQRDCLFHPVAGADLARHYSIFRLNFQLAEGVRKVRRRADSAA